jgi:DNA-binding LytR/AlgR family response regulator
MDMILNDGPRDYRMIMFRKGNEQIVMHTEEIAYFYLQSKICFLVERGTGFKHVIPQTLRELELMLSQKNFYRINKKYVININSLMKFRLSVAGKIQIFLNPAPKEKVFMSQQRVKDFRKWILTGEKNKEELFFDNVKKMKETA